MKQLLLLAVAVWAFSVHATPVPAALVPPEWKADDLRPAPSRWFSVEIARFPSHPLAAGVEMGLQNAGWGPVRVREAADGEFVVMLGEFTDVGEAWFTLEELRHQKLARGHVVSIDAGRTPRIVSGPVSAAFRADFSKEPGALRRINDELLPRMESLVRSMGEEEGAPIAKSLELIRDGKFDDPEIGAGAAMTAAHLWEQRVAPEEALYLASHVASGEWPIQPAHAGWRETARDLTFELLYGHRRDWRRSWLAAAELQRLAPERSRERALARVRKAALLVDLVERGVEPRPAFPDIRRALLHAYEASPASDDDLLARIELVYLQTFAWEGNWQRVEELAEGMIDRHSGWTGATAMARVWLARSLERRWAFDEALEILAEVTGNPIDPENQMRMGNQLLDPADAAREARRRFEELAAQEASRVAVEESASGGGEEAAP